MVVQQPIRACISLQVRKKTLLLAVEMWCDFEPPGCDKRLGGMRSRLRVALRGCAQAPRLDQSMMVVV
jgi:hypothetical protein